MNPQTCRADLRACYRRVRARYRLVSSIGQIRGVHADTEYVRAQATIGQCSAGKPLQRAGRPRAAPDSLNGALWNCLPIGRGVMRWRRGGPSDTLSMKRRAFRLRTARIRNIAAAGTNITRIAALVHGGPWRPVALRGRRFHQLIGARPAGVAQPTRLESAAKRAQISADTKQAAAQPIEDRVCDFAGGRGSLAGREHQ